MMRPKKSYQRGKRERDRDRERQREGWREKVKRGMEMMKANSWQS